MAFAVKVYKARKFYKKVNRYKDEKRTAILLHKGQKVFSLFRSLRHGYKRSKKLVKSTIKFSICCHPGGCLERCCHWVQTENTFANFLCRSICGFVVGVLLTYFLYIIFLVKMDMSLEKAICVVLITDTITILGLTFAYYTVRNVLFLIIPQLVTRHGRQTFTQVAIILTFTGPVHNTLLNMKELSESLACAQEMMKEAMREVLDIIKKPFVAAGRVMKNIMNSVLDIIKKIKNVFASIKKVITSVLSVLKKAFSWLGGIVNICNKKLGTPFERCVRVFDNAIADCEAALGSYFSWLCGITYIIQALCYIVKIFDFICMITSFIKNTVVTVVKRKMKDLFRHIKNIFYVSLDVRHTYEFESQQSKDFKEIAHAISAEVVERISFLLHGLKWMFTPLGLFFIINLCKAKYYSFRYLTNDRFENHYITRRFTDMDFQRAKLGRETVLPLKSYERKKYIKFTSLRLLTHEKISLINGVGRLGMTTLKILLLILVDYSLYWLLFQIQHYGQMQSKMEAPTMVTLKVQGTGLIALMFESLINVFKIKVNVTYKTCLPNPHHPDMVHISAIGFLVCKFV